MVFLVHRATRVLKVRLVQQVNVVLQENLANLVFKVLKEFKVLKVNVVIMVHLVHKEKKVLSVTREK